MVQFLPNIGDKCTSLSFTEANTPESMWKIMDFNTESLLESGYNIFELDISEASTVIEGINQLDNISLLC